MHIEVSEEVMERIINEQVNNILNTYVKNNEAYIRCLLQAEISKAVQTQVNYSFIQKMADEMSTELMVSGLVAHFSDKLADAFNNN